MLLVQKLAMPIYEYEPKDRECLMCSGRVEVLQGISDPSCELCPYCGLDVIRVVSRASINLKGEMSPEKAAKKGFSTFKRIGKGTYERVAGPEGAEASLKDKDVLTPSDFDADAD